MMITFSRTEYATRLNCRRHWYWAYRYDAGGEVLGLERKAMNLPMTTGIYTHIGLAKLLAGAAIDEAVKAAVEPYIADVGARGIDVENNDAMAFTQAEQAALMEALIRAWAIVRLPKWKDEYQVLAVEREEEAMLASNTLFMARPDAVVRRKLDGRLFIVNFKTVGDANERWYRRWETDAQTMSEVLTIEQKLGERLSGVIVEGLIKGSRRKSSDGIYRQSSPLIYGYQTAANPPLESAAYDWQYTRRKGWSRFNVWEDLGIEYWVNWLPQEVLEAQFAIVPPIVRQKQAMEDWQAEAVAEMHAAQTDKLNARNHHQCDLLSHCPMWDICFSAGVAEDPLGSGLYVPRKANHPKELKTVPCGQEDINGNAS